MKKSEITFIRLMSLALIMVINAAVLLFFVGEHTFQNILNRMNSNVYDGGTLDTSIYNYYFYAGFGSIYKIIFPITILLLVTAAIDKLFTPSPINSRERYNAPSTPINPIR